MFQIVLSLNHMESDLLRYNRNPYSLSYIPQGVQKRVYIIIYYALLLTNTLHFTYSIIQNT